jgi:hypothetical protein
MADSVACLSNGKVAVIREGQEPEELVSPYAEQIGRRERAVVGRNAEQIGARGASPMSGAELAAPAARVVGVTRGRVSSELCYAISAGEVSGVFAQKPGTRDEQRLSHLAGVQIKDLDYSFGDEAFTCTVAGKNGSTAIGVLADDGKGVRTVTEGDVLDGGPRWVPGGRGEIVYASAGIGRTKAGGWAGRAPFSLHRLRLKDGTVEVLVSDAKYDYVAPVATSDALIYAIRRRYQEAKAKPSFSGAIGHVLLLPFRPLLALLPELGFFSAQDAANPLAARSNARLSAAHAERMLVWGDRLEIAQEPAGGAPTERQETHGYELVRITPKGSEVVALGVLAFDVAPNGDIVYSNGRALYRMGPAKGSQRKLLAQLERVEQIVIC